MEFYKKIFHTSTSERLSIREVHKWNLYKVTITPSLSMHKTAVPLQLKTMKCTKLTKRNMQQRCSYFAILFICCPMIKSYFRHLNASHFKMIVEKQAKTIPQGVPDEHLTKLKSKDLLPVTHHMSFVSFIKHLPLFDQMFGQVILWKLVLIQLPF